MRFAIYARKSTDSEDRQVQSLEDQLRELKRLALRERYSVVEVFQESRSAKAPGNRPEFDRMLNQVESGELDGILTWAINRLSRNPVDGGRIAYLLQTGKLSMIRTTERTYLPDDNALLMSIENGMATAFIQDLSRNTKRGMRGKFERGWLPGKAPVGYRNDAETREIKVDPDRFALVREAWEMLLTGEYSVAAICRAMQEQGLTPLSKKRQRGPLSLTHLYVLFRNPFYCGQLTMCGETIEGKHPKMVSPEEFSLAQQILSKGRKTGFKNPGQFLFKGLFRCATCGCQVVAEKKTKTYNRTNRTVEYVYYHCSGKRGCSKRAVREEDVLAVARDAASAISISDRFSAWLRQASAQRIEGNIATGTSPATRREEIEKIQARLDKLIVMRADGEIGLDEYGRMREASLGELQKLKRQELYESNRPIKIVERLDRNISLGVLARQLVEGKIGKDRYTSLLSEIGECVLDSGRILIRANPALQKIAALEPQIASFWSSKNDDSPSQFLVWGPLVDDVLKLIEDEITQQTNG